MTTRAVGGAAEVRVRADGPDFVGVGVQKCGSSWLGDVLSQHPQVMFAEEGEVDFFTRRFHRGWGWYEGRFRGKEGRVAGELSVNYIYSPRPASARCEFYPRWNPRRTLQFWRRMPSARDELESRYPGLRVFAIFRDPADRAWSHYWMWRRRRERMGKRIVPFDVMFRDDGRWIRRQGCYADLLVHWREAFPDLAAYFYDDITRDPRGLARAVYRFVGVDDGFVPVVSKRVNAGRYEPMPRETRSWLIDVYRDQILRMSQLTGRDLGAWLAAERPSN